MLGNGMYQVGIDLPAGDYFVLKDEDAYMGSYKVTKDLSNDYGSTLLSDAFTNFDYFSVEDGNYVKLEDCTIYPKNEVELDFLDAELLTNGTFEVGVDLPAGDYKLESEDGWYTIREGIGANYILITADTFKNFTYVQLQDGYFIRLDDKTSLILN
ncbi:hypothetical protein CHL78_007900 [Romboutsia weinsteinii]|uniref:Uncharacterized protein n=1 Tax=Romboutsia weinsteinii TaxID=2020949 RepID=A0A371J5G6_9FIRM|nr:hypothetical protein [Romboutsia weinsteinii]RDY27917.1 hypothetical protein CHL78_007900 [Romboutsia weinsteinii]